MLALSSFCEGFARGAVYLHAACPERSRRAHLPVPKSLAAKSSVSVSSKLIEIKRLQFHYFGHLRKTGGRGSYRLVHTPPHLGRNSPPLSPIIPALARPSLNLFPCYLFQPIGGRVPLVRPWLSTVDCRLLTFHESRHGLRHWSLGTGHRPTPLPLSVSTRQYPAPIAPHLPRTEPIRIPAISGSPPRGYVAPCLQVP